MHTTRLTGINIDREEVRSTFLALNISSVFIERLANLTVLYSVLARHTFSPSAVFEVGYVAGNANLITRIT